jgi:hypothetical protein
MVNCTVYEIMPKNVVGATNGHNVAHACCSCMSKATCTYVRAHSRATDYPHARTHRPISNTYFFSTATKICEPSMLRYTRWFKYDRDLCGLFTHKSVPVIFEPLCTYIACLVLTNSLGTLAEAVKIRAYLEMSGLILARNSDNRNLFCVIFLNPPRNIPE